MNDLWFICGSTCVTVLNRWVTIFLSMLNQLKAKRKWQRVILQSLTTRVLFNLLSGSVALILKPVNQIGRQYWHFMG